MTWDRQLYFPSEGRRAEDFLALKNPTALAGFEPVKLGTKGQHAAPRPPKPLMVVLGLVVSVSSEMWRNLALVRLCCCEWYIGKQMGSAAEIFLFSVVLLTFICRWRQNTNVALWSLILHLKEISFYVNLHWNLMCLYLRVSDIYSFRYVSPDHYHSVADNPLNL
jgi:hypothetical protein